MVENPQKGKIPRKLNRNPRVKPIHPKRDLRAKYHPQGVTNGSNKKKFNKTASNCPSQREKGKTEIDQFHKESHPSPTGGYRRGNK